MHFNLIWEYVYGMLDFNNNAYICVFQLGEYVTGNGQVGLIPFMLVPNSLVTVSVTG